MTATVENENTFFIVIFRILYYNWISKCPQIKRTSYKHIQTLTLTSSDNDYRLKKKQKKNVMAEYPMLV